MATKAIAKIEPLLPVTIDPEGRVTIPSWPEWATSRAAVLERTWERRAKTALEVYRLPASMIPTAAMRVELQAARGNLERALGATPKNDPAQDAAALVIITKMLKVLPGQRLDAIGAEVTGEAYMTAIEDLPVWALAEAMRGWYRGECPGEHDFHWRPAPAELRSLTLHVCAAAHARLYDIKGLLAAEPMREYTPEQRESNLKRLAAIIRGIFAGRVDPIDQMRVDVVASSAQRLQEDRRRALEELAAHDRVEAVERASLTSAGY